MSESKLKDMAKGGHILHEILQELKEKIQVGTRTKEIDEWANRLCLKYKVKPSFLNYGGFPASICVSINDEVVHGLPSERTVQEGDLVSLDFGVHYKGFHTDSAITFCVGHPTKVAARLIETTERALYAGIDKVVIGNRIGDIGAAIQKVVEAEHFGVVRVLVGHGIGQDVHEEPLIPNFGKGGDGPVITEGMTIAIEPMVTGGNYEVYLAEDGWTYKTKDCSLAAHFEHTIYVTKEGPIILTK